MGKSKSRETKGVPLVITFHLKLKLIGQSLNKCLQILYMDQETKKAFTFAATTKFRSVCKLSNYLVRAKLFQCKT